jgi:hypothetical protein
MWLQHHLLEETCMKTHMSEYRLKTLESQSCQSSAGKKVRLLEDYHLMVSHQKLYSLLSTSHANIDLALVQSLYQRSKFRS